MSSDKELLLEHAIGIYEAFTELGDATLLKVVRHVSNHVVASHCMMQTTTYYMIQKDDGSECWPYIYQVNQRKHEGILVSVRSANHMHINEDIAINEDITKGKLSLGMFTPSMWPDEVVEAGKSLGDAHYLHQLASKLGLK